jgi:hypothetical protein
MIKNIPTADELRLVSLRLYFKAWADTTGIITEWAEYGHPREDAETGADAAWKEYVATAQSDLQGIYTLIQQSQKIGLKARLCEVSPYLLLKRTDVKPADSEKSVWDFTDFPTIDASELIRLHNTFCSTVISKEFQSLYDEIRRGRNKISHLGIYRESIEPKIIIDILQLHYSELYPGRRWMEDRLHFAALGRWADYADGDFNERTGLFNELGHLLPELSDAQFKWLMGHTRDEERYVCHECTVTAGIGNTGFASSDLPTAYRTDEDRVRCVICDVEYAIRPSPKCPVTGCGCGLQSAATRHEGLCMKCGWAPEEWEEAQRRQAAYKLTPK